MNEVGPLPNTIYKNNSRQVKPLSTRAKTVKPLEENRGGKLHGIGFGSDLLDITPKAHATTTQNRSIGLDRN